MVRNLGTPTRIACLAAGVMILGLFGALPSPWRYATLIGLIPLGAAIGGQCPVCAPVGRKRGAP
jgi:hypothetical protein